MAEEVILAAAGSLRGTQAGLGPTAQTLYKNGKGFFPEEISTGTIFIVYVMW